MNFYYVNETPLRPMWVHELLMNPPRGNVQVPNYLRDGGVMNDCMDMSLAKFTGATIPSTWMWWGWFDIYQAYSLNGVRTLGGQGVLFGTQDVSQWGR